MFWLFIGFIVVAAIVHEVAHAFFMARNKVEIKTIALGFPPLLLKKKVTIKRIQEKPITIGLSPFFLGAYVLPTLEGRKHLYSLPLDKEMLIYGAGVVSHLIVVPFLLLVPHLFEPSWHLTFIGWGVVAVTGAASFLFFVRPVFTGVIVLAIGFLFAAVLVWVVFVAGLGNTAGSSIAIVEMAREANTIARTFVVVSTVSFVLGAGNAIPMMPLDGGHMLFALVEKVIHAQKLPRIKIAVSVIGWVLLLCFSAFILIYYFQRVFAW